MKKLFLSFVLVAGLGLVANAQTKIGISGDFAFPTGNFGKIMDYGAGASANLIAPFSSQAAFVGEVGYLNFTPKKNLGFTTSNQSAVPIKAGVRYLADKNIYLQGSVGAAISTQTGGKTAFLYAPSVGADFPVSDKMSLDFGLRYEGWTGQPALMGTQTNSFIGIRAALNFGL